MALATRTYRVRDTFYIQVFFADAFNYIINDDEPIIRSENLHPIGASENLVPYGNQDARFPIERLRDRMRM